jgi:outer membrane PBP1 activator LpoA protein
MHRVSLWLFVVAALYVSGPACATDEAPSASQPVPHIALLLPLKSAAFGPAAEAVQQGFLAAAERQPQALPIRVYGSVEESNDIGALYRYAVENGARAVAGPLTRNGVAALADTAVIAVPTLALNQAETDPAENLFFFGLPAEAEARQAAQLAAAAGLQHATIIISDTALFRRLAQAFAEKWQTTGGQVVAEIIYADDPAVLADIPVGKGYVVFLATDAEKAQIIRPYLNKALPVYATSQLFNGNTGKAAHPDLNGIHFVDMPWLLQPDHPAVMIYPRPDASLTAENERLYALGIDAFRLVQIMLKNAYTTALPLDGVTGIIKLNDNRQFQRTATPGVFRQGRGIVVEEAARLNAPGDTHAMPAFDLPP